MCSVLCCGVVWCGVWARRSIRWLAGASCSGCLCSGGPYCEREIMAPSVSRLVRPSVRSSARPGPARPLAVYLLPTMYSGVMMHPDFIHICLFALVSFLRPFIHSPGVCVCVCVCMHQWNPCGPLARPPVFPSVGLSSPGGAGRCEMEFFFPFAAWCFYCIHMLID